MLRSCRLCARQLEASRSLAISARSRTGSDSYYHQDHHDHQQQGHRSDANAKLNADEPIASTSRLVLENGGATSASFASSCGLPQFYQQRRSESTSASASASSHGHENRFEHNFHHSERPVHNNNKKTSSPWKGKARAVEFSDGFSAPLRLPLREQKDKMPISASATAASSSAAATTKATASNISSDEDFQVQHVPDEDKIQSDDDPFTSQFASRFEAGLAQENLAKCYSRLVQEYLYRFEQDRPSLESNLVKRIRQLHDTFATKPRSSAVQVLKDYCQDDRIPPLEIIVPLLVTALFDQMEYTSRRTKFRQVLLKAIDLLQRQGCLEQAEECLEGVLREYRKRRRWEAIEGVAPLALGIRGWTPLVLEHYLHALDQSGHHHKFPEISSLTTMKQALSRQHYDLLIKGHLCNRNLAAARAFLALRLDAGLPLDAESFNVFQSGYRSLGGYETLLHDLAHLGIPASSQQLVHNLLAARIQDEGPAGAIEVLSLLESRAQSSPVPLLDTTYSHTELTQGNAITLEPEHRSLSNQAQSSISAISLKVYAQATLDELDQAVDSYTQLMDTGMRPSAFITSTLLMAYRRAGKSQSSSENVIKASVRKTPKAHQEKVYRRLTSTILNEEGIEGLKTHLKKMTEENIRLDDHSISVIAKHFGSSLTASKLAMFVQTLRQAHGSQLSISDFNLVLQSIYQRERAQSLSGSNDARRQRRARTLPSTMISLADTTFANVMQNNDIRGLRPDAYTVMLVMKRYADGGGSPYKLWQFFRLHILEAGIKPTAHHISALMTAYCNAGDSYGARRVMDRGQALGVKPTIQLWTILLQSFAQKRQPGFAQNFLLELQQHGFRPDLHVYTALASAHAEVGNSVGIATYEQEARNLVSDQSGDVNWPNVVFETLKFNAWIVQRRHYAAHRQLARALDDGLEPDDHLYRSVDNAYRSLQHLSRQTECQDHLKQISSSLEPATEIAVQPSTDNQVENGSGSNISDELSSDVHTALLGSNRSLVDLLALGRSNKQRISDRMRIKRKGSYKRLKQDIDEIVNLVQANREITGRDPLDSEDQQQIQGVETEAMELLRL